MDKFAAYVDSATNPARQLRAITPSDTENIPFVAKGIFVGTGGTISILAVGDTEAVTLTVQDGAILPIRARRINATGTTATGLVALI